jgi:hypothetical protein
LAPDSPDRLPPRPIPPKDEDCCRSDCPNCVFNLYDRALEAWNEEVERIERERKERPA